MPNWLIFILVMTAILGPIIYAAVWLIRRQKARERMMLDADDGALDDATCVSCGSKNVTHPEPDIVLCSDCGYEGGEGIKRRQAEARAAKIAAMSPAERLTTAGDDLRTACRHLNEANSISMALPAGTALNLAEMTGWTSNSANPFGGDELATADGVSKLINAVTQAEACVRDALDKVASLGPGDRPEWYPFEKWQLSGPFTEFTSTRNNHSTTDELSMALTPIKVQIDRHLALFPTG